MREMIAMLDGLGSYEVEPGNGSNFVGGAAYPGQGFPVWPSSTGLAAVSMEVEPGNGGLFVGGAAYPGQGFPVWPSSTGLAAASEPGLQFQRAQFLNTEINNRRRLISVCERVARQLAANCPGSSATVADAFRSAGEVMRRASRAPVYQGSELRDLNRVLDEVWRLLFRDLTWCSRTALVAGTPLGVAVGQLRRALGLSA